MVVHWIQSGGYLAIFLAMILESACIPLPSEVIMPLGGYLAFAGHLNLWAVIACGVVGNIIGGLVAYYVGKLGGRPVVRRYGRWVHVSERHLEMAEKWFNKRGDWVVFVSRMLPAIRTFISLPAGIADMPVGKFIAYTGIGSIPWVGAFAFAGFKLGQNWANVKQFSHPLEYVAVAAVAALIVWILYRSYRSRRSASSPAE